MNFTSYAVETQASPVLSVSFELQWAQNGARIQSKAEGSALLWGFRADGAQVLLEAWADGAVHGRYAPAA